MLNYPASDLIDILTGKTSFQRALESPLKIEAQRAATNGNEQLPNDSEQLFKLKSFNDLFARVRSAFQDRQVKFLKSELKTCSRSANLASMMFQAGKKTSAERTIADAEQGYATVLWFLSNPEHSKYLTIKTTQELTAKLEGLRKVFDGLETIEKSQTNVMTSL